MLKHWFWFSATVLVVVWYSSITIYVAIRGAADIKQMLRNLARDHERKREQNDSNPS
jgi:hypothetical protein